MAILHSQEINFYLIVDEENKKLLSIYWTPKLHKHTSKTIFIIAAL